MSITRLVFRPWLVESGLDTGRDFRFEGYDNHDEEEKARTEEIQQAVSEAIERLDEDEREYIRRIYFLGQTTSEIARLTGRAKHRLEGLHRRAHRRLKKELAPTAARLFGYEPTLHPGCPLCESEYRHEIDQLIASRDPTETWRPVIRQIQERFGIRVSSAQMLVGHWRYHEVAIPGSCPPPQDKSE